MKKIRYAIIGAGTMGLEHIQNISLIKEVFALMELASQLQIKKMMGKFLQLQ